MKTIDKLVKMSTLIGAVSCSTPLTYSYQTFPTVPPISVSNKIQNNFLYIFSDRTTELPICLTGEVKNDTIKIREGVVPPVGYASADSTSFDLSYCQAQEGYIGMAHYHTDNCFPSAVDFERFFADDKAKLEVIVCLLDKENGRVGMNFHVKD